MKRFLTLLAATIVLGGSLVNPVIAAEDFKFDDVEDALEESTQAADIEELYEMDEPITIFDEEDITYEITGYKLYELKEVSRDWDVVFDRNRERGGVLAVQTTIKNDTDEPITIGLSQNYEVSNTDRFWGHTSQLIPEENEFNKQIVENKNVIEAGEEVTGYEMVTLTEEALDQALKNGEINYEPTFINLGDGEPSASDRINPKDLVVLPISEEGEDKAEASGDLYPDKVVEDNLGSKTLLEEETDIDSQTLEDIDITIDGYQIAEFEPNEENAPSYEGFKDGVILYTIKYTIENNSDKDENAVAFNSGYANLIFNESVQYKNERMLQPETVPHDTVLEKGDSATGYFVFALSKDDYEMYEGKSVKLDMTVMDKNFSAINEYQGLIFDLIEED
ncbi:hypothetical protein WJ437_04680 [Ignavigranum ruoffiae]|uniref:hypothetical protein n=1 Tax=Ignavigranum ruoffiae TaxID=89093 RepID=UPI002354FDD0|nr:hypothetical protein [Ignavigranum ruoffiae]